MPLVFLMMCLDSLISYSLLDKSQEQKTLSSKRAKYLKTILIRGICYHKSSADLYECSPCVQGESDAPAGTVAGSLKVF